MARGLNKVMLIGRVGQKPEARYTPSGAVYANLSIATSEVHKNKEGEWEETTEWHQVVVWSKLAEVARDYLDKGAQVYVEGRLQTRSWVDSTTGDKRYRTEIVAHSLQMLGAKAAESTGTDAVPVNDGGVDDDCPF